MALTTQERESLKARGYSDLQIASLNAGEVVSSVGSIIQQPITGDLLEPISGLPYKNPNPDTIFPVSTLNSATPPLEATQPENQAQDLTNQLQESNKRLQGQAEFRAEQERLQGVPALTQTQTDLSSRLKTLQNEALAIPLQLQQEAVGRGITTGGLRPIQTEALRKNAIQALSINSLLEASRGNLATAQALADRAVAQRFDPIKEEIAVKTANLDLILKSPDFSRAEKNRAQAQLDIQNSRNRQIAKQEENSKIAQAMITAAVTLNPNNQTAQFAAQQASKLDPTSANYLQQIFDLVGRFQRDPLTIQKSILEEQKTKADIALTWANVAKIKDLSQILSVKDAQLLNMPFGTTKEQAIAAGKIPGVASEAGVLKANAKESAQALFEKFTEGIFGITTSNLLGVGATSAVGKSRILTPFFDLIPGTRRADFLVQFNNVKSLLSLDNVKYLKGQGQVSDAERKLLSEASAKLDLSQSESEFNLADAS